MKVKAKENIQGKILNMGVVNFILPFMFLFKEITTNLKIRTNLLGSPCGLPLQSE